MFRLIMLKKLGLVAVVALILVGGTRDAIATGPPVPCNCCSGGNGLGCDCQPCENVVCALDPFCCQTEWDNACNGSAVQLCTCCTDECDDSGDGSPPCNCCSNGNGIGCDCQPCQNIICGLDPFCCNTSWDSLCNNAAAELCTCCAVGCDDGDDGGDVPAISNLAAR